MAFLPSFDLNGTRLGFLNLGQHQREHAVFEFRSDLVLVDLAGKAEAARIMADIVLGIEWLQPLISGSN
jgi:hypothetical protein